MLDHLSIQCADVAASAAFFRTSGASSQTSATASNRTRDTGGSPACGSPA